MFISNYPDTPRLDKDGIDIQPGVSARIALSPVKVIDYKLTRSYYGVVFLLFTLNGCSHLFRAGVRKQNKC